MQSVECKVWSVKLKGGVWSVECGVWSAAAGTQNDDGHVQSVAPEPATKNATHLLKTSRKYRACHTK